MKRHLSTSLAFKVILNFGISFFYNCVFHSGQSNPLPRKLCKQYKKNVW